jgi:hypothetical protein
MAIVGHLAPIHTYNVSADPHSESFNGLAMTDDSSHGPLLLGGNATVQETFSQARLDVGISTHTMRLS